MCFCRHFLKFISIYRPLQGGQWKNDVSQYLFLQLVKQNVLLQAVYFTCVNHEPHSKKGGKEKSAQAVPYVPLSSPFSSSPPPGINRWVG